MRTNEPAVSSRLTLIQAQQRYIDRITSAHPGHLRRVRFAAYRELHKWAEKHGFDAKVICQDAKDIAELERITED